MERAAPAVQPVSGWPVEPDAGLGEGPQAGGAGMGCGQVALWGLGQGSPDSRDSSVQRCLWHGSRARAPGQSFQLVTFLVWPLGSASSVYTAAESPPADQVPPCRLSESVTL